MFYMFNDYHAAIPFAHSRPRLIFHGDCKLFDMHVVLHVRAIYSGIGNTFCSELALFALAVVLRHWMPHWVRVRFVAA